MIVMNCAKAGGDEYARSEPGISAVNEPGTVHDYDDVVVKIIVAVNSSPDPAYKPFRQRLGLKIPRITPIPEPTIPARLSFYQINSGITKTPANIICNWTNQVQNQRRLGALNFYARGRKTGDPPPQERGTARPREAVPGTCDAAAALRSFAVPVPWGSRACVRAWCGSFGERQAHARA